MTDLTEHIEQAALDPASASADGQSATAVPIPDLIEADKYLAGKKAAVDSAGRPRSGFRLLRPVAFVPPGSC